MTINHHIGTFAGLPVAAYPAPERPDDASAVAWRIDTDYDGEEEFAVKLAEFLAEDWLGDVKALIIGQWGSAYDSAPPIEALVAAADKLTGLRALFLGEMTFEECEISWIQHEDITPLLTAYPELEVLRVRGSDGLEWQPLRHERLRSLTIESGGLPAPVVRGVGESDLPALTDLELWLGTDRYGGDATVKDLAPILTGTRLPALRRLGLRDAKIADLVAAALAEAPVVARLSQLDLSLGTLSDTGAAALLAGQSLTHLDRLDLHHHYLSKRLMKRLAAELAGVDLDLSDDCDPDDEDRRYVAVSE